MRNTLRSIEKQKKKKENVKNKSMSKQNDQFNPTAIPNLTTLIKI